MERSDILAPLILLETTVVTGRTYQAHKRGGFIEARERFTEEIMGSIFWLFGFKMFSNLGDKAGKALLGLKDINFDVASGNVRKPLTNFVKNHSKISENKIAAFKCTKVIGSILLSNAIIGFVVPKINQAITRQYQKSIKNVNNSHTELYSKGMNFDEFKSKSSLNKTKKANPSFGFGASDMFAIANLFENNATAQLLSNDVGTAGGRAINARNKHERYEILFRDVGSIYFYMFCRHNINSLFNKIESGNSTRLNTVSAKKLHDHLVKNAFANKNAEYTAEEFATKLFGNENAKLPDFFEKAFQNEVMDLDTFNKIARKHFLKVPKKIIELARQMSELQPKIDNKSIITKIQLQNAYKGGLINEPEFLHSVLQEHFGTIGTEKLSDGTKKNLYKIDDKYSFVGEKSINKLHEQMKDYAKGIIDKALSRGEKVTLNTLKKANHANFAFNLFNLGFGFAVASFFLSTAIPKIQYWITKITTGKNSFPGVSQYNDNKTKKKNKQ